MSLRTWFRDWLNAPSKEEVEACARANARLLGVFRTLTREQKALESSMSRTTISRALEDELPNSSYVAGSQVVGHPAEPIASKVDAKPTAGEGSASE